MSLTGFRYQIAELPPAVVSANRVDSAWHLLGQEEDSPVPNLAAVMLAILVLPHSNAECERIFNSVQRNDTEFRPSMSHGLIESLSVTKVATLANKQACYQTKFADDFLSDAKSATYKALSAAKEESHKSEHADSLNTNVNTMVLKLLDSPTCDSALHSA